MPPPELNRAAIRAICFDLDDTLWDFMPVIQRAERILREHLGAHHPALLARMTADWMVTTRARMLERHPEMRHDFTFLRRQGLRELAQECGEPEQVADLAFEVFFAERNRLEPFDDVIPSLQRLKPHFRLATLSNGNADLSVIGLASYFDASVAAREAGALKPAAVVYTRVLERLGMRAHEVLHVGDDPLLDVHGPRQFGMPTVWVDRRGGAWPDALPPPDHRVASLSELADWLLGHQAA